MNDRVKNNSTFYSLLPGVTLGILIIYFFLFEKKPDFSIQKHSNLPIETYSDATKGGSTKILGFKKENGIVNFSYKIGNDLINYAGFNYLINDSIKKIVNDFNAVRIKYSTENIASFGFIGKTFEEGISVPEIDVSHRVNYFLINPESSNNTESIEFNYDDLKVRDWWKSQFAKEKKIPEKPDWKKILMFSIIEESNIDNNLPSTITIHDLVLKRNHIEFYLFSLLVIIISTIPFIILKINQRRASKSKEVIVTYKSLEIEDRNENQNWEDEIFAFIGNEYPNAELKLQHLSKHLLKSERAISAVIHKKLNITFKQYLNSIRIKEAKKLLSETNLSIKEITYAVGYSSPNNFRRVFKQIEGVSATEFRENL